MIRLQMAMAPQVLEANPRVADDTGRVSPFNAALLFTVSKGSISRAA